MTSGPPNAFFSAFAFIGFIIALIPFRWHYRAGNVGLCIFMAWAVIGCLNGFVNSLVWNKSITNTAPVWCDISTRIMIAGGVSYEAATVCIALQLYVKLSKAGWSRRKEVWVNIAIGVGIPLLEVTLSYLVLGNRFNIFEDIGCYPAILNTPLTYVLVYSWPLIVLIATGILGALTIRHHILNCRLHPTYDPRLLSSQRSVWRRQLSLSLSYALITIPLTAWTMAHDLTAPDLGFTAHWHARLPTVNQFSAAEWHEDAYVALTMETSRWQHVLNALTAFVMFGVLEEGPGEYRRVFRALWARMRRAGDSGSDECLER
ncbi:fungal pheromone STE3G-protein-coupled receptor [Artomyces pyxidatus]|uniref:Fungal pheromone STE3G-protein-coupled receptor n=1 Tax=Artomyces pyxidatus TaxID=48021 RepID=A0ACB8SRQ8_9AGAM|nr:fungal pheromone STE3G-protein-coupled receptor [Artomyces pyxidatus]